MIAASGLTCGWRGTAVVRDLDLSVAPGELALLIGANGAGKTTTLMTLAGALPPISGQVLLAGAATSAPLHARARAGLAFVPQDRSVFARLTVRDNLRLGPGPVDRAVGLFEELAPLLPRRAGTLSGGEQQMVRLGRALAGQPRVLLIDELSLGLSPLVVQRLFAAVRAAADGGAAVLVVEQHVQVALELADRGYVLAGGGLALAGEVRALRDRLPEIEAAYLSPGVLPG
jgi:branched-chain amino acid transport system ATP-binding protein